jgi:hypothetical protein
MCYFSKQLRAAICDFSAGLSLCLIGMGRSVATHQFLYREEASSLDGTSLSQFAWHGTPEVSKGVLVKATRSVTRDQKECFQDRWIGSNKAARGSNASYFGASLTVGVPPERCLKLTTCSAHGLR